MQFLRSRHIYWLYTMAPVAAVLGLAIWTRDFVGLAVARNPALNLTILGVIVGGVLLATFAMLSFQREARTLEKYIKDFEETKSLETALARVRPGPPGIRDVLSFLTRTGGRIDGPMAQAAMAEEIAHYREGLSAKLSLPTFLSGFMIALGLFGTFIGLLDTLTSTGALIQGVASAAGADANASVVKLITGIQAPLLGMGTSFSASLFGLLGSLVLGAMLNALQALTRKVRNELRSFLDEVVVFAAAAPAAPLTREMMSTGLTEDFLGDFLVKVTAQHKEAVDSFGESRATDREMTLAILSLSQDIRDQVAEQRRANEGQDALNRALKHQIDTMEMFKTHFAEQASATQAMRQSHEDMVRIVEHVDTGIDEVRRLVNQQTEIQGRVIQTERRTGELFEMLNTGIAALGDRDMILRDMQRSAIDAVKHASQIGVRINEGALSQYQARVDMTNQIEAAMAHFADFKREQAASAAALSEGLRDLMKSLERRNGEVITLIQHQSSGAQDLKDAVGQIPQSLEAAHTSLVQQAEFSKSLVSELRALREAGRR